jgi:EAL domain-containing protein (putative c-di-GMP-specific phosphodiesterase class I)
MSFGVDDYGTGYSCLRYLKLMPVDFLKIDRSFIAGLGEDPGDEAIVSGTINLAHALGLRVVAEGVETAEQLSRLEKLDCDLGQGLHLYEPLTPDEVSDLLARAHR